jgi:hypothetical protein
LRFTSREIVEGARPSLLAMVERLLPSTLNAAIRWRSSSLNWVYFMIGIGPAEALFLQPEPLHLLLECRKPNKTVVATAFFRCDL